MPLATCGRNEIKARAMNVRRSGPRFSKRVMTGDLQRKGETRPYSGAARSIRWSPTVGIVETPDRFALRIEMPGVDPAGIDVSAEAGVLSICGERHAVEHGAAGRIRFTERVNGQFRSRFSLPEAADIDRITAKYSLGILEVSIPKALAAAPRRIDVEAA